MKTENVSNTDTRRLRSKKKTLPNQITVETKSWKLQENPHLITSFLESDQDLTCFHLKYPKRWLSADLDLKTLILAYFEHFRK